MTFWNLNYGVEQISSVESNGESSGEVTEKSDVIINLNNTEKQIIKLKNAGIIMREGSTKNGNWKVVEDK